MVFRILSRSGLTLEDRTFALQYDEQLTRDRLVRTIVMHPAALTVAGVERRSEPALRFEQVEFLTDSGDSSGTASADIVITTPDSQ